MQSAKTSSENHIHTSFLFLPEFCEHFLFLMKLVSMWHKEGSEDPLHEQRKPWPSWFKCFLSGFCCVCVWVSPGLGWSKASAWGGSGSHIHPCGWIYSHTRQAGLRALTAMGNEQLMDLYSSTKNKTFQIFTKTQIWKRIYW